MFCAGGKAWAHAWRTLMGVYFLPSVTLLSAVGENKPALQSLMLALIMPSHKPILWFIIKIKYIFSVRSEVLDERSWKYWQKNPGFPHFCIMHSRLNQCWIARGSILVDPHYPWSGMMETVGTSAVIQSRRKLLPLPPAGCSANPTSLSILLQLVVRELTGIPILQSSCRILLAY